MQLNTPMTRLSVVNTVLLFTNLLPMQAAHYTYFDQQPVLMTSSHRPCRRDNLTDASATAVRYRRSADSTNHPQRENTEMDDEMMTVEIDEYEKNNQNENVDQTMFFETSGKSGGQSKMTFQDNLVQEDKKIRVNSRGDGRLVATATDSKPKRAATGVLATQKRLKRNGVENDHKWRKNMIINQYVVRTRRTNKMEGEVESQRAAEKLHLSKSKRGKDVDDQIRVGLIMKDDDYRGLLPTQLLPAAGAASRKLSNNYELVRTKRGRRRRQRERPKLTSVANRLYHGADSADIDVERPPRTTTTSSVNLLAVTDARLANIDWVAYVANSATDDVAVQASRTSRLRSEERSARKKNATQSNIIRNRLISNDAVESGQEVASLYLLSKKSIDDYFEDTVAAEADDDVTDSERMTRQASQKPNGIELDVGAIRQVVRSTDAAATAADAIPSWLKTTNVFPKTIEEAVAQSLKQVDSSNTMFQTFSDNPAATIPWEEPAMMTNCWIQLMLSTRYSFAPSCEEDGTFLAKQCYLERCWCVDYAGKPTASMPFTRFYYKEDGIRLTCAVRPRPLPVAANERPLADKINLNLANVSNSWPLTGPGGSLNGKGPAIISMDSARRNNIPASKLDAK